MSTYLQLCQKLKRDSAIAGPTLTPTTVVNQTGVLEKLVGWVSDSYRDIQMRHPNWRWMRSKFMVLTTANEDTYAFGACTDTNDSALIARFWRWWPQDRLDPFRIYLTSGGQGGEYFLIWIPYEDFRRIYEFGVQTTTTGQPIHVSVDDLDRIVVGPNPGTTQYTISGKYQRGPQILAANGDVPEFSVNYHDLIVYYAMQRYAYNSVAPEVLTAAKLQTSRQLRALEAAQLPGIRLGGPLA
jgi:hypothetical protein